ncbi:MAG: DUF2203 domain-containing protein [Calditrichota bacterium]
MDQPRFFTLDEANALLPQLSEWLKEIQDCHGKIIGVVHSQDDLSKGNGNLLKSVPTLDSDLKEVGTNLDRIRILVDQIQATGAEIKDLKQGLIDFRHWRGGREVYLCWLFGEPEIRWWHELDTGLTGRQPL